MTFSDRENDFGGDPQTCSETYRYISEILSQHLHLGPMQKRKYKWVKHILQ